ncbi:threonine dehydratase 1 biosynthetic, chloroplastic-like [Diospyros lotus]|uniref:threonine dehydratase 1 biosynthetic, chloroplastic-like n=1 Tax=Diospyros lotus TaxID=55363 RepID=UPI00225840A7|nr:threonine dehydratase 1 biosynthetic, chloroplastic-like [Diospyros lotus]
MATACELLLCSSFFAWKMLTLVSLQGLFLCVRNGVLHRYKALCFAPPQPPVRRAELASQIRAPTNEIRRGKIKPFIRATLSDQTPEISLKPKVASRQKQLEMSPSPPPLLSVSSDSLQYPAGFLGVVPDRGVEDGGHGTPNAMEYLSNILASKVYDVAVDLQLQFAPMLSERLGETIWLKREDLHFAASKSFRVAEKKVWCPNLSTGDCPAISMASLMDFHYISCTGCARTSLGSLRATDAWLIMSDVTLALYDGLGLPVFSFKLQGAYNMMAKLPKEQLERGVICASAGNHAEGVALSAQRLGCNAVIAMPVTTPEIKWKLVEELGATVVLVGDSYDEAQAYAEKRGEEEGHIFVPLFDHPDVIAGHGTIGMEIVRQMQDKLHAIFVPVGGGGLIAGIAIYIKRVSLEVKIIWVEPADANAMALSLHHGQRIMLDKVGGFADGVAVKVVGEETFRLCRELIDGVVLASRDAICASIKDMPEENGNILEPAGAIAFAGAEAYCKYYGLKGENIVAITSGANMNFNRLRLVSGLADVGRQREAVLATFLPEVPGSFKQSVGPMNITEFKYRYKSDKEEALVLYRQGLFCAIIFHALSKRFHQSSQLQTVNLTNNDLAKDHLRHLMWGQSSVQDELLCRFVFPERPGALMKFLDAFSPRRNISLFHYRGQGEKGANVLVGIQVAGAEMDELRACADRLGYEDYVVESGNEVFHLLTHYN